MEDKRKKMFKPIIMDKLNKKKKEKPFDMEEVFDKSFKPGGVIKEGKKEKKTQGDKLVQSFTDRKSSFFKWEKY